jgi:uncharacterized Ntn-hydrolase superfamily protein
MKPTVCALLVGSLLVLTERVHSQDTFSIVAVDPLTGEVGSAGASCIAGSIILSDVHPGVGVIHTQSFWHAGNQNYARTLMNAGYSPEDIIDSLVANDAQNNPSIRQYGIIDLVGGGRSAGYTGVNCFDYKNHLLGPDYAIAGNILLGQQILDSMEVRFLGTIGMLSDRLMAALQGAKVPGADTRCLAGGRSSISAFIRVAKPGDTTGVLFLDLNVNNAPVGVDPIDSLQVVYDEWRGGVVGVGGATPAIPEKAGLSQNYPNPFNPSTTIEFRLAHAGHVTLRVFDQLGREIATLVNEEKDAGTHMVLWRAEALSAGVYFCRLEAGGSVQTRKLVLLR